MSEMAKAARAAMKSKATRMGGKGEPKTKVDASTWSPPEMMNTGMKVGMRPLTRRAFKKGGKVIEKCEGGPTAMRADRKQRKAGGRSLVTDLINRNDKKANLAREGGDAHVGGYKSGGDVEQDKKLVKKAFAQHDKNMHGGKHEELKLKKGGRAHKEGGGLLEALSPVMLAKKLIEGKKSGGRTKKADGGKAPEPTKASSPQGYSEEAVNKEIAKDKRIGGREAAQIHRLLKGRYAEGGKAIPGDAPTRGYTRDGSATGNPPPKYENIDELMKDKGIGKKRGGGTYFGGTRPTGGRMPKADGGKSDEDYWTYKAASKTPELEEAIKAKAIHPKTTEDDWAKLSPGMRREILRSAQRKGRKAGGRTKGKTNIIISINAGKPQDQQAMMPKMPTPSPMPVPPVAPPPMGAGAPPPMPMPPPGLAGGPPPPGMPPMPRKRGGRAYKSYKDMDAGALSGMGRMEKTEIEHGKRVGRLSGGRARSYKDMDAGSLSGMGRIEKTAIQKHKR